MYVCVNAGEIEQNNDKTNGIQRVKFDTNICHLSHTANLKINI